MMFTATIILSFLLIGVAAVGIGHFARRQELYIFGVVIVFFMGLAIVSGGVAVQTGITTNTTSSPVGNDTVVTTTETYAFDQATDMWTNGLGLLCVVAAAGMALTWFQGRKKEKHEREQSVELED